MPAAGPAWVVGESAVSDPHPFPLAPQTRYCRVSVPTTSKLPQSSLLAVWRKRAVVPANVSMVGAGVMVPQASSPMGRGALTTASASNA